MYATEPGMWSERTKIELKPAEVKKYPLGTKVRIVLEGSVVELRAAETYELHPCDPCEDKGKEKEKKTIPPCMYVKIDSTKSTPIGSAQISAIVASDEDEDEDY